MMNDATYPAVAQLVRALPRFGRGRRFESLLAGQN